MKQRWRILSNGAFPWDAGTREDSDIPHSAEKFRKVADVCFGLFNETPRRKDAAWPQECRADVPYEDGLGITRSSATDKVSFFPDEVLEGVEFGETGVLDPGGGADGDGVDRLIANVERAGGVAACFDAPWYRWLQPRRIEPGEVERLYTTYIG